jgi:ubiquitin-conjugating enzyme E2 G1
LQLAAPLSSGQPPLSLSLSLSLHCNPSLSHTELAKNPIDLVSVGLTDDSNVYDWEILIMGPDGTLYEGGFFKARLVFPPDFPNMPPTMTFTSQMWHPNVYQDGKVCISILHPPGEDAMNSQESADERWRPILGVEAILMSVISMLSDPNDESPANLDAAVQWRNDMAGFKKKVRQCVRKSQEEC